MKVFLNDIVKEDGSLNFGELEKIECIKHTKFICVNGQDNNKNDIVLEQIADYFSKKGFVVIIAKTSNYYYINKLGGHCDIVVYQIISHGNVKKSDIESGHLYINTNEISKPELFEAVMDYFEE